MKAAIDAGITTIDTARGYGLSETRVGGAMDEEAWEKAIVFTKTASDTYLTPI